MKAGYKTTEFWLVAAVILFCVLSASGVLTSSRISTATSRISDTAQAVPGLIAALQDIVDKFGTILVAAGVAWAYLRKRATQKEDAIEAEKNIKVAQFDAYKAKMQTVKKTECP